MRTAATTGTKKSPRFGTRAVDACASVSAVREIMGHVDIVTAMRYVHATDAGNRLAVEAAARRQGAEKPATNLPQAVDRRAVIRVRQY